ncbi:MAG TPA: serine/threonine-protein kinase [Casimicrobiaceae bacterium]|nr:serine/threonine-protein kinase [Casimicrobiaceae bacterium]
MSRSRFARPRLCNKAGVAIDKLGRYEIRRELGRGAMGVVYEAYDPMIKRVVALKTVRADQLARDDAPVVLARFRREAQAAGRLTHPNIVAIYDFDEDEGTAFIAMEHVAGRDLKELFESGQRFTTADAVRLMGQVLDALDYSHRQGVVHRDVKPGNVFVQPDGTVKVADFGIAHIDTSSLTQDGSVLGTPSYMSPEQILGLPVDGRSDLFSAGVILYQFLTGERPFTGSSTTTMQKVLKEDPLPPTTLNVQLPEAIDAVIRKALAKRPEERYQTAAEFAAALRSAASVISNATRTSVAAAVTDPARASDPTLVEPTVLVATPTPTSRATASAPQYASADRKSQSVAIAVVFGFVFVAAAAATWFFAGTRDKASTTVTDNRNLQPPPLPATVVTSASPAPSASSPSFTMPPAAAPASNPVPVAEPVAVAPGTLVIAAQGLADPSNPRYRNDASLMQADLRADAKGQLVEKALRLLVEPGSLAKHYDALSDRFLANSGGYIETVMRESEPSVGKDGLATLTTEAVVNVRAVQKSLNEMTRNERIDIIRAKGDPRIAMQITVRDAQDAGAAPRSSPAAENLLKERVKSFGFRTWSEAGKRGADFLVSGDAVIRRLTTRLEASGITITKYAVASLTVKCIDQTTGEEIYYKTVVPKGGGSYATEEEAVRAVGERIADEFSRDFFLQHVHVSGRRVSLVVAALPDADAAQLFTRELVGLPTVVSARARAVSQGHAWDLQLAGSAAPADLVAMHVLAPLNAKLGADCLALAGSAGDEVQVRFEPRCNDEPVRSRLQTHPPAGLYDASSARRKSVITNPETLRKLSV